MLPSFETQRLIVRPRGIGDLNACLAMDRDPAVLRYIDVPWRSTEEHRQFVVNRITRAYPAGLGYWSVVLKLVPAAFVGWVLLTPYDAVGPEIEIGWRLLRSAWGNGFATEASLPVLRHGFETVHLDRIVADIHPDNADAHGYNYCNCQRDSNCYSNGDSDPSSITYTKNSPDPEESTHAPAAPVEASLISQAAALQPCTHARNHFRFSECSCFGRNSPFFRTNLPSK